MTPFDPRTGDPGGPEPHRLRIGDAEREQAAAALGEHYAMGRLSDVEHGERLDAVWSARTRSDLDVLFHDLPAHPGRPGHPGATAVEPRSGRGIPTPVIVILVVSGVIFLLRSPLLLLILLVVAFVMIKNRRRRARHQYPAQHPGSYGRSGPPGPTGWR